jgi:hypothetical protein
MSGLAVGITLLAGALFLSAAAFPPRDSASDHKFQFVLIIVNDRSLIYTVYGIYMIGYLNVCKPPVWKTCNCQRI